jgi:hypothetical protein
VRVALVDGVAHGFTTLSVQRAVREHAEAWVLAWQ